MNKKVARRHFRRELDLKIAKHEQGIRQLKKSERRLIKRCTKVLLAD